MIVDTSKLIGSFARHETFHPRYGWLRKAYEGAKYSPDLFSRPDAIVQLGVGKNMVNAIRYWGVAFDLLDEVRLPGQSRGASLVPSALAKTMFSDDGWDPYLEDPASLWLLHWRLLRPRCAAPAWWMLIHHFEPIQFTEEQALRSIVDIVAATPEWARIAPASIKKDIDCALRMYAPAQARGRDAFDDLLDCPFRELGLLEPVPTEARTYRWVYGPKASLAPLVVAHAAVDYALREAASTTVTLTRLATAPGGPGRAFKLPESALYEALREAAGIVDEITVESPGGIRQLVLRSVSDDLPMAILERYYLSSGVSRRSFSDRLFQRRTDLLKELAQTGVSV